MSTAGRAPVVGGVGGARDARGAAIAVWVKTPGWSPVKTRLAATIGRTRAEAFYARAVCAVAAVVRAAGVALQAAGPAAGCTLAAYWAVAEDEPAARAVWRDRGEGFATVLQGSGGLGERQAHVYDTLREHHPLVLFVGTDSPQMVPGDLVAAVTALSEGPVPADFVVGPAEDGGYYLFGGRSALPSPVWTGVPYSDPGTLAALRPRLEAHGRVATLPARFDVDTADEFARLGAALAARHALLLPEQRALLDWLDAEGAA